MHTIHLAKSRAATATMLAAGALVAGSLMAPPASSDADIWVALAYSWKSSVNGFASNGTDSESARFAALRHCQDVNMGNHCIWFGSFRNECAAMAIASDERWATGAGPEVRIAQEKALSQLPGGRIAVSGCPQGAPVLPAPPRKVPFTAPSLAPTQQ
ncbi:DUF4189 domain-containing protein [Mycolicibacterium boenickei]